jgi:hypothetical protein
MRAFLSKDGRLTIVDSDKRASTMLVGAHEIEVPCYLYLNYHSPGVFVLCKRDDVPVDELLQREPVSESIGAANQSLHPSTSVNPSVAAPVPDKSAEIPK